MYSFARFSGLILLRLRRTFGSGRESFWLLLTSCVITAESPYRASILCKLCDSGCGRKMYIEGVAARVHQTSTQNRTHCWSRRDLGIRFVPLGRSGRRGHFYRRGLDRFVTGNQPHDLRRPWIFGPVHVGVRHAPRQFLRWKWSSSRAAIGRFAFNRRLRLQDRHPRRAA
jgi:hypothetical protein